MGSFKRLCRPAIAGLAIFAMPLCAHAVTDLTPQNAPAETVDSSAKDVQVPAHPLTDARDAEAERQELKANSDAELDKQLGLNQDSVEPEGLGFQLFKTLITLGIVIGLIYLSLNFGLRKLMGVRASPTFSKNSVVQVLERIPIEPKRTLFVLRAAGEYLLVGSSEGGMSLLSKLDSAEVDRIQREKAQSPMPLSPFFQKLLTKKGGPPPSA